VADTISFTDSSDHHHNGKEAFALYLKDAPPPSRWEEPFVEGTGVTVNGEVQKMWVWWGVTVHFTFSGDKISTIKISRK